MTPHCAGFADPLNKLIKNVGSFKQKVESESDHARLHDVYLIW